MAGSKGRGDSSGVIKLLLYADYDANSDAEYKELVVDARDKDFVVEELCCKAAEELKIGSLTFPLFTLFDAKKQLYLHPNGTVTSQPDDVVQFEFRARFMPSPKALMQVLFVDDLDAAKYLYLQFRHDFINDRFTYTKHTSHEHILGLLVMDMVRYGKHNNLSLKEICGLNIKPFMPHSVRDTYKMPWQKKRLQNNLKEYITQQYEKEKENTPNKLMKNFIFGLKGYVEKYGAEVFDVDLGPKVCVDPYRVGKPSIYRIIDQNNDLGICDIGELVCITFISSDTDAIQVMLNRRNGQPEMLKFSSKDAALSFIALLDGYHRLKEDYYHCLCPDAVQSPQLKFLQTIGCHGPVPRKWAEEILRKCNSIDVSWNYMLKQRHSPLKALALGHISADKHIDFYTVELEKDERGQPRYHIGLEDEPVFSSIQELLKYYKSNNNSRIKLKMCIRPSEALNSNLYLCKEESNDTLNATKSAQQHRSRISLVPGVLLDESLGHGQFTEVYRGRWEDGATTHLVAIKRLRKESQGYLKEMMTAIHKAAFWSHATITAIHAVCLAPNFSALMEHGKFGPLHKFLSNSKNKIDIYTLIMAAEQLGQALLYLESCHNKSGKDQDSYCHGNIRARNIVVFEYTDRRLRIKLCDPGMVYACNKLRDKLEAPENAERLPWIAPELYTDLTKMTIYSDRYAYGITLWEILSQGDRPFKDVDCKDIQKIARENRIILQKPHQECPDKIYELMKRCWHHKPQGRISAKEIVRDICNLLQSDYNSTTHQRRKATNEGQMLNRGTAGELEPSVKPRLLADKMTLLSQNSAYAYKSEDGSVANGEAGYSVQGGGASSSHLSSLASESMMSFSSTTPLVPMSNGCDSGQSQLTMVTSVQDYNLSQNSFTPEDVKRLQSPAAEDAGKSILRRPFSEMPEMPKPQDPLDKDKVICDYSKDSALGDGHYGTVYKGFVYTNHGNPRPVAIKQLKTNLVQADADEFRKEFDIMTKLKHCRIVEIIGHRVKPQFELIMEFVENGSLNKYLQKHKNDLLPRKMLRFGLEIVEGMEYLHNMNIVHRDLAARNILVTKDDHMKISDFGLARVMEGDYYMQSGMKALPVLWTAPEALLYKKYTTLSDVWSFGITLWEIFKYGDTPHYENLGDICELTKLLSDGTRLAKPNACPQEVYDSVLMRCWRFNITKRITFSELSPLMNKLMSAMTGVSC